MSRERLLAFAERIEILSTRPEAVKARWFKLWRPILRRIGWRPTFRTAALGALLLAIAEPPAEASSSGELVAAALEELSDNVAAAERAAVVNRHVPVAHAAWLHRLLLVLARALAAAEEGASAHARRMVTRIDPVMMLPPLAIATSPDDSDSSDGSVEGVEGDGEGEPSQAAQTQTQPDAPLALLDLELAAVDHLLDAARAETELLGRRQRLLEAARQLLLETSAALPLDRAGAEARRRHITEEIVRIERLRGAGLSGEVSVLHQAREALQRGDRDRLHAALCALDGAAVALGDADVAERTGQALERLRGAGDRTAADAGAASIARSAREVYGPEALDAVAAAYRSARKALPRSAKGMDGYEREKLALSRDYLARKHEGGTLAALLATGGCFEVGGALSPMRVVFEELRARAVAFPTADLALLPARTVTDVTSAVIEDPRAILMNLAQGRLLTRKFTAIEALPRARTVMVGQARVYVLDGSGSMHVTSGGVPGARARMRDAILLAELATLRARCQDARRTSRVVLYFRYFNDQIGPICRVASADEALSAMDDVAATIRVGGTDIEGALTASFEQVREARGEDPALASAQIVLVTDGDAKVREDLIDEARRGLEDLPIGVSVIALGEENPALRGIVARQRARGERAFYHHIDDEALARVASGQLDRGPALHLPEDPDDAHRSPEVRARDLEQRLGGLLQELADLDRSRHVEAIEAAEAGTQALAEVGLDAAHVHSEGERARTLSRSRDRRALEARFARWFPAAEEAPPGPACPGEDVDATVVALAVVGEIVGALSQSVLSRRADAIELLERLLPDARLSPGRYDAVLRARPAPVLAALLSVHRAVAGPS